MTRRREYTCSLKSKDQRNGTVTPPYSTDRLAVTKLLSPKSQLVYAPQLWSTMDCLGSTSRHRLGGGGAFPFPVILVPGEEREILVLGLIEYRLHSSLLGGEVGGLGASWSHRLV